MDKLLDMMSKWEPFGQGLFLFFLAVLAVGGVVQLFKLFVALFRGWPPPCKCDEEEDV